MVLESFIRKMMEKYLSDILDGVDHQAVSLQLLKGEVTLDDVKIKPSFLKSLALPFPFPLAFHRAIVHHLQLAINWKLLTSQPLLVKVEGIHLWAEAKAYDSLIGADSAYVQHVLAKAIQDKLDKLARDEEVRLALAEADDVEGFKKPSTILARLVAIVTTSLQLEINDLHVCISVPGVDEHPGLHMGLALEHFKFETADTSSWHSLPLIITGPTYKSLTVKNLSVYLNPDGRANVIAKEDADADEVKESSKQVMHNMPSLPTEALPAPRIATAAEVAASIHQRRQLPSGELETARYQFLIKPVSLSLNLTFNKNIIPTVEVHAVLDMPHFQVVATRPQVLTLRHLYEVVSTRTTQVEKWIDKQPPKPAMNEFQQKRYMFLYKRTLNALWLPELDEPEMKEKEAIERELPYEELSLMRRASTLELKKELGEREKIGDREQAIAARTHWWDKLFRSEESTKKSIESSAEPEHQLTEQQKGQILSKVRKEGTDEEQLDEADAFKLEDVLAALTFHVSAEINVGEIGLELWQDRQKVNDVIRTQMNQQTQPKPGESVLAVAAREQRERDDKDEVTDRKHQRTSNLNPADGSEHYEGEALEPVNLRPLMRLQINRTTIGLEVEPDGDVQMDVGVDSIQFLDLTLYNAKDPWSAGIVPQDVRVEFGYIGPVVPQGPKTLTLSQSVVVNEAKPYTVQHVASPSSVPVGVVLRLRRSKDTMNSQQRSAHLHNKAQERDTAAQAQNANNASQQRKDRSVTDILFGQDPAEDKDSSAHKDPNHKGNQQQTHTGKVISPPAIFSHSVPVRTSTDVQVNNLRLSYTDSLLEAWDFIKAPPSAFTDAEKERMEKGDDVMVIDSAQADADRMEQQAGGEIRHDTQQVQQVADPAAQRQHQSNIQGMAQPGQKGVVETGGEKDAEKADAKNKKDRLEKEKAAIGEDVKIVPGAQDSSQSDQSAAGRAGGQVEGSNSQQTVGDTKEDEIKKPLSKTLPQFLTFFSPMLVRLHVPQPYISVIPDTAAKQLQRLTFSLNANARALLDADKDSIFARADVTNTRAWLARTEPVHAISLAPFHPPTSDANYLIKPFNIGLSLERYPSPLTQLVSQKQASGVDVVKEFGREVGDEQSGLDAEDVVSVFEGADGAPVYHMDADVDISAIHIKLAAKMWYMLQPLIQRVQRKGQAAEQK